MSSYRFSDNTETPLLVQAVTGTNTYTINVKAIDFQTYTFQCEWTTGFSGTISVFGSLDGVNFRNFGASVSTQPADSVSGVVIPLYGHGMKWLQISYTNVSGSGTLTVSGLGKTR